MAAYSNHRQQYYPAADSFILDSFLEPDTTTSNNMSCFSTTYNHETYLQIHGSTTWPPLHESCTATTTTTHDDPSLSLKQEYYATSSAMAVELGSTHLVEKKRKNIDSMVDKQNRDGKKVGVVERKKRSSNKEKKVAVEVPAGYVHVRARRGQATDSHSLAERVRRQKISVRMKLLQSLVPGCDKMTGKALILDEIIRYVRTLQSQVQFLATKVASINPMLDDFDQMHFNTNPLSQETTCMLDFEQLPPVLESSSTQLLLHQEQSSNVPFQDNCSLLWGTDDSRKQQLVNQYGLHNQQFSL